MKETDVMLDAGKGAGFPGVSIIGEFKTFTQLSIIPGSYRSAHFLNETANEPTDKTSLSAYFA